MLATRVARSQPGLRARTSTTTCSASARTTRRSAAAAAELDGVLAPLVDDALGRGATVVALSEYGITSVDTPVHVNRALRAEGLLHVYTQDGMEYLDPWTSRAFAVADHQVAHVYVRDPADVPAVAKLCAERRRRRRGARRGRQGGGRARPPALG